MAQTWIFNNSLTITSAATYTTNFTSGPYDDPMTSITTSIDSMTGDMVMYFYDTLAESNIQIYYEYSIGGYEWSDNTYKTIVLENDATGDLLTFLEANATQPAAIAKVAYDGNTLIDLTTDTVASADDIAEGKIGHLNNGRVVTGTHAGGTCSVSGTTLVCPSDINILLS